MGKNNAVKHRYDRIALVYDEFEYIIEQLAMSKWRKKLWELVEKGARKDERILEIGVGTGKNIPYYPLRLKITAIDFSPKMLARARKKAKKYEKKVELKEMDVQDLDFPDNSFDHIVTTCVFCSVPKPTVGFAELQRVVKPDGKLYLLEHVQSKKILLGPIMDLVNFMPKFIWGANINRDTLTNLKRADLEIQSVENLWLDILKLIIAGKGSSSYQTQGSNGGRSSQGG